MEQKKKKQIQTITFIILLVFVVTGIVLALLPKEKPKPAESPVEEPLIFNWEYPSLGMNIGETRELYWESNKTIQPLVFCEGSAVAIVGMIDNGIRIRAIDSGMDVISLQVDGQETVCVVTVSEEQFQFELADGIIRKDEREVFSIIAEPKGLLVNYQIRYTVENPAIAAIVDADNSWIEVVGLAEGATTLVAEWRGKRTDLGITVFDDAERKIVIDTGVRYINVGQQTKIIVQLDEMSAGDESQFRFVREAQKDAIGISYTGNEVLVIGKNEGIQFLRISHPRAKESVVIKFDVIVSSPMEPPRLSVSESPLILRKDQTKRLDLYVYNVAVAEQKRFDYQVVENAYAITVRQEGNSLMVTGIAPGAAKIRIRNASVSREYDVMVLVDDGIKQNF